MFYTWIMVKDADFPNANIPSDQTAEKKETKAEPLKQVATETMIEAPLSGAVIPLSETNDQAFSSLALGKGLAIKPTDNTIVAPFSGTVSAVFPGNHAIGLTSDSGIELLIHIGIDTVNMQGESFVREVNEGDHIHSGQKLLRFDSQKIREAGYEDTVMITVTNTSDYLDVIPATDNKQVSANEQFLAVF